MQFKQRSLSVKGFYQNKIEIRFRSEEALLVHENKSKRNLENTRSLSYGYKTLNTNIMQKFLTFRAVWSCFFLSIKEEKNKEERGKAESIPLQMESLSVTQKLQEK